ncbi:hypothetical protein ACGFRG_01225 [Streptomyces sp. NPDC048696]|uniref:hypothetical protein n=1 Tax=Streptomyces sp. NPDC048696 TaxID=3365585 RepID=UPI0037236168
MWAKGHDDGPVLRLQIRPRAAYRANGAGDEADAAPIGYGWNGSFTTRPEPQAAVLLDCAPVPGKGLYVMADTTAPIERLSAEQMPKSPASPPKRPAGRPPPTPARASRASAPPPSTVRGTRPNAPPPRRPAPALTSWTPARQPG